MANAANVVVNASPTKEFFIYMLTRDIELSRAILDLVDYCVDGAIRTRGEEQRFDDLFVRIDATPDRFHIADNCGGMTAQIAREYAFRFGRPKEIASMKHSIGQFGVGMKRALFKLGTHFEVRSTTADSKFVLDVNVDQWLDDTDEKNGTRPEWEFVFSQVHEEEGLLKGAEHGTSITVRPLHVSVADDFGLETFQTKLQNAIADAHQAAMENGLNITLNGLPLQHRPLELLSSADLQAAHRQLHFPVPNRSTVNVQLYAGIAESRPADAGWYVFCNGRLVLGADQTDRTVWGEKGETRIPKAHNQFARFRGFAYFDSDEADLLPWNTTKTGIDSDSRIYQAVRLEMIALTRPVINFLNELKTEAESDQADRPLETAVAAAQPIRVADVIYSEVFRPPTRVIIQGPRVQRIQYDVLEEQFKIAKARLGARNIKEVGEKTFDYYYQLECAD